MIQYDINYSFAIVEICKSIFWIIKQGKLVDEIFLVSMLWIYYVDSQ